MSARPSLVSIIGVTLADGAGQFLARRDLDTGTLRSYGQTLRRLRQALGDDAPLSRLTPDQVAAVFTAAWDQCAARTWNRHRAALRSLATWASGPARGWVRPDLAELIDRRPALADHDPSRRHR